ncbi:hypothetical protein AX16_008392 [Volvariella volvacea WC 439]|nr:hypothetical protein AX16_008392 [Volvariella volvacea WC 439]
MHSIGSDDDDNLAADHLVATTERLDEPESTLEPLLESTNHVFFEDLYPFPKFTPDETTGSQSQIALTSAPLNLDSSEESDVVTDSVESSLCFSTSDHDTALSPERFTITCDSDLDEPYDNPVDPSHPKYDRLSDQSGDNLCFTNESTQSFECSTSSQTRFDLYCKDTSNTTTSITSRHQNQNYLIRHISNMTGQEDKAASHEKHLMQFRPGLQIRGLQTAAHSGDTLNSSSGVNLGRQSDCRQQAECKNDLDFELQNDNGGPAMDWTPPGFSIPKDAYYKRDDPHFDIADIADDEDDQADESSGLNVFMDLDSDVDDGSSSARNKQIDSDSELIEDHLGSVPDLGLLKQWNCSHIDQSLLTTCLLVGTNEQHQLLAFEQEDPDSIDMHVDYDLCTRFDEKEVEEVLDIEDEESMLSDKYTCEK